MACLLVNILHHFTPYNWTMCIWHMDKTRPFTKLNEGWNQNSLKTISFTLHINDLNIYQKRHHWYMIMGDIGVCLNLKIGNKCISSPRFWIIMTMLLFFPSNDTFVCFHASPLSNLICFHVLPILMLYGVFHICFNVGMFHFSWHFSSLIILLLF